MSADKAVKNAVRCFVYGIPFALIAWSVVLDFYSGHLDRDGLPDNDEYAHEILRSSKPYFVYGVLLLFAVVIALHPKASWEYVRDITKAFAASARRLFAQNDEHPLP